MTEHEYNILDNMIDDYTNGNRLERLNGIIRKNINELEDIEVRRNICNLYNTTMTRELTIKHLLYIRDEVVICDCEDCCNGVWND